MQSRKKEYILFHVKMLSMYVYFRDADNFKKSYLILSYHCNPKRTLIWIILWKLQPTDYFKLIQIMYISLNGGHLAPPPVATVELV